MGFIREDIIAQVLDRTDIVALVQSYIPLKRAGVNFKACCPFHHEKTPSFIVGSQKQIFHCFGCGVGGNAISFVMRQEHLDFPEAVRHLAEKSGIIIPEENDKDKNLRSNRQQLIKANELAVSFFHNELLSNKTKSVQDAREYLQKRKIRLDTVKMLMLGFALDKWDGLISFFQKGKHDLKILEKAGLTIKKEKGAGFYDRFRNRIIFPIFDNRSHCIGFGARTMGESQAKYINSPETSIYVKGRHLYGLHLAKDSIAKEDLVVIVEGYMDFLMPFQEGLTNIVASLGTALTIDQVRLLRRYTKNVCLLFDSDPAGESAMFRSIDLLIEEGMRVKVARLQEGEDPDSFVRKFGIEKLREHIDQAVSLFDFKLGNLKKKFDMSSIEGRALVSNEMLTSINKFDDAVVRTEYLKKLSLEIGVSQEALVEQMKKISKKSPKEVLDSFLKNKMVDVASAQSAERNLLLLMCEEEKFVPIVQREIKLADLQDERIRNIVSKIFDLFKQDKSINIANLMNCFSDELEVRFVTELLSVEETFTNDKERVLKDCLERIKRNNIKVKKRDLEVQLKEAESSGDYSKRDKILNKINQLIKR